MLVIYMWYNKFMSKKHHEKPSGIEKDSDTNLPVSEDGDGSKILERTILNATNQKKFNASAPEEKNHGGSSDKKAKESRSGETINAKTSETKGQSEVKKPRAVESLKEDRLNKKVEVTETKDTKSAAERAAGAGSKVKNKTAKPKNPKLTQSAIGISRQPGEAKSKIAKVTGKKRGVDKQDVQERAGTKNAVGQTVAEPSLNAEKRKKHRKTRRAERSRQNKQPRYKHTMPAVLRILCSVLLLAGMTVIFTWFILWRQNLGDFDATKEFINEKPILFAYSGLVVFMLMSVIAAVTWRPCFTVGLVFSLISIITYINAQKLELRDAPLLPEDFLLADQAGDIMQFVDIWSVVRLAAGVVLVLVGSALLEYCVRRTIGRDRKKLPWWDRWALVPRTAFTMVALAGLVSVSLPMIRREEPEWLGDDLVMQDWNPIAIYKDNGFVIGTLYNLGSLQTPEPDGYSEEAMKEIARKYRTMKANDRQRVRIDEVVDNVIVILDETFYDPALLTKYYTHIGGDVTPNLHRIFQTYPSGYMYSPEYGGNTANVEFEVMTSLSNYWAKTFPYVHAISKSNGVLAVADWTKNYGFDTLAIHSYNGNMYKRNIVYPKLGFNRFIDAEDMRFKEHEYSSGYINDRSVFREILQELEESSQPMMIGAVTMQNHMPYDVAHYPSLDFPLVNIEHPLLENSFQSLHAADAYVGEFLAALDEFDERTVVLWFGDHAAGLLDGYIGSEDKDDRDTAHLTPYFIYANFEIESEYTEAEVRELNAEMGFEFPRRLRGIDLPVTTPNCLQNTMYDVLGVEKPSLLYLVDAVCESTPILAAAYVADAALTETSALKDYELVNYDVLSGKHYWDGE